MILDVRFNIGLAKAVQAIFDLMVKVLRTGAYALTYTFGSALIWLIN